MKNGQSVPDETRFNAVARFAVHRKVSVAMLATALIVLGVFAIPRLAISLLPSFSPPIITVNVTYPNVAPASMETLVTRPVENAVSRVAGIDTINSTSSEGSSQVRAQFHYGVNIDTAAVDVQEQVDAIRGQLPNDPQLQTPQIQKADPNALPVIRAYVTDSTMSLRDLNDLFTNQLNDEFSAVQGVGSVSSSSADTRAIMIQPDANKLAGYGLTASDIVTRISQENLNLPAGIVQIANNEYQIQTNALYQSAQQIADTIITTKNGAQVYLRDLAAVSDSIEEERTFNRVDGQPALSLAVSAQPDANVVGVANGVYAKIDQIKARYPNMKFGVMFDQRGFILDAITALEHTGLYGAILAVLIILLFLHSWRSTMIVAISLPISILGTLFAAYLFHYSLNTMTLGGLALAVGLVVDDAIVVIENIYRHYAQGQSIMEAAEAAVTQIFTAVLASSITVITVFVPLVLIPGLQGLIFTPFAVMVMVAVAISFVVAVTTVPMLSTLLWSKEGLSTNGHSAGAYARFSSGFDRMYDRFAQRYKGFLGWSVDRPAPVLGVAALLFFITLVALKLGVVQTELFPASNSRFARFTVRMPTGTALNVTNAVIKNVESRIRKDPRVVDVGASVGTGGFGGGGSAITNQGTVQVTLKPGTSSTDAARFIAQWQGGLSGQRAGLRGGGSYRPNPQQAAAYRKLIGKPIPGVAVFGRTIDILQQIISQGQDALQIQIFGPDINQLSTIAHQIIPQLSTIPGIARPDTNITAAQPLLNIQIDRTRAASLGLSTAAVSQAIDTATSGSIASYLQINGTEYPIFVQLPPSQRRSYASVADLSLAVPTAGGTTASTLNSNPSATPGQNYTLQTVPLTEVANVSVGTGPSQISRQNKQREIDVTAALLGTTLGDAVTQATAIMNNVALPAGYHWQFGPAITQQSDTFGSLALIVALSILLIYMLLAAQFESLLHPLVIMMAVPLSLFGVVAALMISHRAFGLTAFIGVLMLVGIVVKNAILVVEFTNQLRRDGFSPRDALLQAAPLRLRPIIMTSLATIGGMLPLTLGLEAGSSTQAPLGTVVVGGLLCSTLLSLVVVPTLYLWTATHIESRFIKPPPPARTTRESVETTAPVNA